MCGITGFFSKNKQIDLSEYYRSHKLIAHRGIDDEGFMILHEENVELCKGEDSISELSKLKDVRFYGKSRVVLGHRRLSILDLSIRGHQPMVDREKEMFIVYNGEIFNYIELRNELRSKGYQFNTDTDTEVLMASYREWGNDCFQKFNGMWAVAIYDAKEDKLILSRDRFGIKPLYYKLNQEGIFFSSEMRFIESLNGKSEIDVDNVKRYVEKCYLNDGVKTFCCDILEVLPGHIIEISDKVLDKCYWNINQLEQAKNKHKDINDYLEEFTFLFEESIKMRMRSDVEVGALLSGGLDSNTIVYGLNKLNILGETFSTFSAIFEHKFSEKPYIDITSGELNVNHYYKNIDLNYFEEDFEKALYHLEEPVRSLSSYMQYLVYKELRDKTNVKVVLNGQGADEIFAGYSYHYYAYFTELINQFKLKKLGKELNLFRKNRDVHAKELLALTAYNFLKARGDQFYLNTVLKSEIEVRPLREYLRYDDRTAMAFGVEARPPFLDHRLVEFAFASPTEIKIESFVNKKIVRDYANGVVNDTILNRKDKVGFLPAQGYWQKDKLRNIFLKEYNNIAKISKMYDEAKWLENYKAYFDGKKVDDYYIWRLFCLSKWMKLNGKL